MATAFETLKQKNIQFGRLNAFERLKQKETTRIAQTEVRKKGFVRELAESIIDPFARTALTATRLGQSIGRVAEGDIRGAQEVLYRPADLPFLGKTEVLFGEEDRPIDIAKKSLGTGLEIGATVFGGGAGAGVAKGAFRAGLRPTIGRGVLAGAVSGTAIGAGTGLREDLGASEIASRALTGGIAGGAIGGAIPLAFAGARKAISVPARRSAEKIKQAKLIEKTVPEKGIATKKLLEGRVVTDKVAKEVVRQGIPEADVALIKAGSKADKIKMSKMLDVRQRQLTNKRVTDRATDVVGETFINRLAKPIEKLNKEAGKKLDIVAQRLAGKKVDPTNAILSFSDDLERAGIRVSRKTKKLNFRGSTFEGLSSPQKLINNVWNRALKISKSKDALQLHRTKSYIDEIVNYGKQVEGLSGRAQSILKSFRRNIDTILDNNFPAYNKANTVYADTIRELNSMGVALGRKFRIGETFADAQAGLKMRRILSNTNSRSEILKLLDSTQKVLKKYGIKIDEDIIIQSNFADILEKMLGSEAPASFLGQIERGVSGLGGAGADIARGKVIGGTVKAGKYLFDVTRGINQENAIKALQALLRGAQKSPKTVFGRIK